jgi:murein DD-endopeptidase MepM/ murein hydrolase activator NlpD
MTKSLLTGPPVLSHANNSVTSPQEHADQRWKMRVGVLTVFLATGAIAVAGFTAINPKAVPIKQLVETVTNLSIDSQINSLSSDKIRLYRTATSRSNDTAETMLSRLGIFDKPAADFMRSNPLVKESLFGKNNRQLNAEVDDDNHLMKLTVRWATESNQTFQRLVIEQDADGFKATRGVGEFKPSVRLSGGFIQSSLFAATDEARIPDSIAVQLAEIFSGDIDFHRALRKGDRFTVTYESLEADGEPLKPGKVLTAEFVNKDKTHQAMWFQENPKKPGGYYNLQGQSLRRTYLASPLAFSRVTSGFSMRFHPIFQTWRAHLGVDYAAPQGTPVRSVGVGTVESAGNMGGYGNAVVIKHNNGHATVYAHLSKLLVRKGQSVSQGQTVGLVGATGWATGPHLHFEFRVNGVHKDPQQLARQSQSIPVPAYARDQFNRQAAEVSKQLALANLNVADVTR